MTAGKASVLTYFWCKVWNPKRFEDAYLNIGCGPKYVEGMVNLDGNMLCRKDVWLDIRLGLPFPADSVRGVYTSHLVEHLTIAEVRRLLKECQRILKKGCALRIVVPSLEYAVNAYVGGKTSALPDWPERYRSLGGRFNNFMLCAGQHRAMFDVSFLEELLLDTGFAEVKEETAQNSRHFLAEHMKFELDPALRDNSIYVETVK